MINFLETFGLSFFRKLKIIDAIYRRAGHILVNFWRIYYYTVLVQDTYLRLQVAILQLPVIFTIKKCTEFNVIGNFVFQGCRIRDGQYTTAFNNQKRFFFKIIYLTKRFYGRFNQVVVNYWAYCARIIMMILLLNRSHSESVDNAIFIIAMQPLIWGDTFGEVIGSFYGKREFYVRGIGEVNKKTVEGTVGCFVSSFVSLVVTYGIYGSEIPFVLPTVIVLLYGRVFG